MSFNYFRKWIYAWNDALCVASISEVIVPPSLIVFTLDELFFCSLLFARLRGNISWKSNNNLLSLSPVIYRPFMLCRRSYLAIRSYSALFIFHYRTSFPVSSPASEISPGNNAISRCRGDDWLHQKGLRDIITVYPESENQDSKRKVKSEKRKVEARGARRYMY